MLVLFLQFCRGAISKNWETRGRESFGGTSGDVFRRHSPMKIDGFGFGGHSLAHLSALQYTSKGNELVLLLLRDSPDSLPACSE